MSVVRLWPWRCGQRPIDWTARPKPVEPSGHGVRLGLAWLGLAWPAAADHPLAPLTFEQFMAAPDANFAFVHEPALKALLRS